MMIYQGRWCYVGLPAHHSWLWSCRALLCCSPATCDYFTNGTAVLIRRKHAWWNPSKLTQAWGSILFIVTDTGHNKQMYIFYGYMRIWRAHSIAPREKIRTAKESNKDWAHRPTSSHFPLPHQLTQLKTAMVRALFATSRVIYKPPSRVYWIIEQCNFSTPVLNKHTYLPHILHH